MVWVLMESLIVSVGKIWYVILNKMLAWSNEEGT